MDLRLFITVLWRFRLIVIAGTLLAITLATLSAVRVEWNGKPGLAYRSSETWESSSVVLLTQEGFPWGRSTLNDLVPLKNSGDIRYGPRFADLSRFQGLALIYASLAGGDQVRDVLLKGGPIDGAYGAEVVQSSDGRTSLPMIEIQGLARSPAAAAGLANRVTDAFRAYLEEYQDASNVPESERVDTPVIRRAAGATLTEGRSMTRPVFIFLLMMTLVIGLAFVLQNLRPQDRRPAEHGEDVALMPVDPDHDHERVALRSTRR
jgi:hypothetical protein